MNRQSFLIYALATGLTASTLSLPTTANAETAVAFETKVMYTNHGVYARTAPNTTSSIVTTLVKNTELQVIDGSKKSWYRVLLDGEIVYVYGQYVTSEKPTTTPALKVVKKGYVSKAKLSVRASASAKGKKRGTLKEGATVQLTQNYTAASKDTFFQVLYKGKVGYVEAKHITFTKKEVATTKTGVVRNIGTVTLKVRQEPSVTSTILGTLQKGEKVKFATAYKKDAAVEWYKIIYKGKPAYVSAQYVTLVFPNEK